MGGEIVSDLMLLGVLEMPAEMVMDSPISVMQYIGRGHEAAERIRSDGVRIAELEAQLAARTSPTADDAKAVGRMGKCFIVPIGPEIPEGTLVYLTATAQPAKEAVADTGADSVPLGWAWERQYANGGYTRKFCVSEYEARELAKDSVGLPRADLVYPFFATNAQPLTGMEQDAKL
jgi:hypothetical protein